MLYVLTCSSVPGPFICSALYYIESAAESLVDMYDHRRLIPVIFVTNFEWFMPHSVGPGLIGKVI